MFEEKFSKDVGAFFRSPTRDIFRKVDLSKIYSFSGGYPSASTFALEDFRETMSLVIDKYGAKAFQYGATQGVNELRDAVARRCGVPVERIQITTSSQQGIDICTRVLVNPGDVVLSSDPTYLGALQSFCSYRADIVGVRAPHNDVEGFRTAYEDAVKMVLAEGKTIKFLYMIPDFQNPSGETLSLEERRALAELAEKYDFLIVEDSPYRELRYEGEDIPTIYSMAPDRTLHLCSFSKIFAPGFRLGWIVGHPELLEKIYICKQALDLCPPIFDQYVAAEMLESGRIDRNLEKSIALYREKRDKMLSLLEEHMPQGVSWTRPEGGLFIFLTMPEGFDSIGFYEKSLAADVAYVSGAFFSPAGVSCGRSSDGKNKRPLNTMRLNFSFIDSEKMEPGIKILARLLKEELGR